LDTAQQVAQQAQHIAGLTTEAVTLLKAFFMVTLVITVAMITALVKTRDKWLPAVRGIARDGRESDPRLGNGSLRDDFNKAIGALHIMVSEFGSVLLRSNTAFHERLDAVVVELRNHIHESEPLEKSIKQLILEQETERVKRGLGRVSTSEERDAFKKDHEGGEV
jgi:hypothetical protein